MENEMEPQVDNEQLEDAGRATDDAIGHLTTGEVVIPVEFLQDPQVAEMLQVLFQQHGADIAEFTVGDPANKINPETGYPEFFKIGSFLKKAANVVLPNLGAAGGFTNGLIQGKGLGGALRGGLTSGLQTAASMILPDVVGDALGSFGDSLPSGVQGPVRPGTGIAGAIGKATGISSNNIPSLGGLVGSSSGGGGSSFNPLGAASNIYGAYSQDKAIKKQQNQLLDANRSQLANLDTFDPSGITSDPGYEFQRAEGQKGLTAGLNAGGSLYSGKALKAASQYNQNYASNAFNDYYQRWLTKVNGQNSLIGSAGDVQANATGAKAQNLAQSLSNIVGAPVGSYGQGLTLEQLRKLGMAV